ncbi:MAG: bifunctional phosphoglucose/phosphomannose isomerase [Patescibacteria group bacterium]
MEESIRNIASQFNFNPEIENLEKLGNHKRYVVSGMGGSHLSADILKNLLPNTSIIVHQDYGFPHEVDPSDTLFIASSFSGNTEETLDFAKCVLEKKWPLGVVTKGGNLLKLAQDNKLPFVLLPDVKIQPRIALGYSILALSRLLNQKKLTQEFQSLSGKLNSVLLEEKGKELQKELSGKIPVIYSSKRNEIIAYNWKIKFNETGKIPAFFNTFPELNHNELEGFDHNEKSASLSQKFLVIAFLDTEDNKRIQKRMNVTLDVLSQKGVAVKKINLEGETRVLKIFNSLIFADWTAFYTAKAYGHEPNDVPLVEEFKRKLV